jgi:hypothetical protein
MIFQCQVDKRLFQLNHGVHMTKNKKEHDKVYTMRLSTTDYQLSGMCQHN